MIMRANEDTIIEERESEYYGSELLMNYGNNKRKYSNKNRTLKTNLIVQNQVLLTEHTDSKEMPTITLKTTE